MCACNGTGVIQNDIGMGMYQFGPCICEAANQTHEEVDRKRHAVMAELREIHQLQLEGKWDAETWDGFGKGELHNGISAGKVHEEIAS
ncbi:hypothetical protein [Bacillus cereus]|uniref:Uncharacterized protein n=1 Tax=Bacillus cereus TaxID=1396 RepID=A0A164FSM2_BACCE|nr:hypothetical protein [Bacillus cereus]KZD36505.1 hypothetical protein B4082_2322 [Bacillus cereus]